jgi:hypothetical protein
MNLQMESTRRFTQNAPAWLPPITHLYLGTLFIVQTLRAQREVSHLTSQQSEFLRLFEETFDLRSLLIPGPAVPFFLALSSHSSPFEDIGDVTPAIPQNINLHARDAYRSTVSWQLHLPALPYLLDLIATIRHKYEQSIAATPVAFDANFPEIFSSPVATQNATVTTAWTAHANIHHLQYPGASYHSHTTLSQLQNAAPYLMQIPFPPRLSVVTGATTGPITDLKRYIGFIHPRTATNYTSHNWFGPVSTMMQRYSQYFKASVPLSAISATGNQAGTCLTTYSPNPEMHISWSFEPHTPPATYAATNHPTGYRHVRVQHLKCSVTHPSREMEEVYEQSALLSQINVTFDPTTLTDSDANTGPAFALPIVRRSQEYDISQSFGANITLYYHADTRQ